VRQCGYGNTPDLVVQELALARVQPCPYLKPEIPDAVPDYQGASNRACRPVEGCEEAITRSVDFCTSEARELATNERVVIDQ
jgi:hypothetical protein